MWYVPETTMWQFIGFIRPGVGAIPLIAELQAMFWSLLYESASQHHRHRGIITCYSQKVPESPTELIMGHTVHS